MVIILSVAWAYVTSLDRTLPALLCALFLAGATTGARGADWERPRRVLMVHSFGSSAPPFTTHSTAFESTLKRELGTSVDLDEVSLDMARYAQPDMEEAFAEFLGKRMSEWQPDLVVPIGSPAGKFVAKFRDKLFPLTPVIYTGMDRRTLPDDAFANNATFVGENFDLKGLVEDMLQLDPETHHVVVILGATTLERYWTAAFQEAFEPFAGRVKFTYVNDLSFDQMLDLVSKLPPHSFVLLGLFMRDASGVTYNEDDALVRLHAVSQAPINGLYQHQMGLGIVGGRLYQGELEGVESARVAARILRGEQASSFTPMFIGTRPPTYDWRELTRWGISESRLPPGSVVMFRQPTVWERYRWQMVGTVALIATQAVLISALLIQRRRRNLAQQAQKKAQAEVQQKRDQMGLAAEAANAAMWVWDVSADDLWMTEQGRALFGFKPDARINFAATMDRVHPEDRATRERAIRRALEMRGGYEIEYRLLEPDGVVRWIKGRARCVEPNDGTGLKLFGVSMDVTARKQAEASAAQEHEELRKKRAELEHVARIATLGELTATVVHEIAQPLAAILANSSAGIDFLDAPEPDLRETRAALSDICADTERAAQVIRRLRDLLKRDTPGFTSFDLNQLIRDVDRIVHGDAVSHKVTVELDLSPGVLLVKADNVQLQQVILNLMLNAFSAMGEAQPSGARRLIVRTKSIDASNVLVELEDSGTGIAPEKLESIFDPFITNKRDAWGSGLRSVAPSSSATAAKSGQPTIPTAARRSRSRCRSARVSLTSSFPEPMRGDRSPNVARAKTNMTSSPPIVRVVDDDDSVRTAVARLLRAAGYEVRVHASAGDFLLNRQPDRPGCVILDVRMPGPSGLDLQESFVKSGDSIPIVFLSGHGDIPTSVRAIKAGAVDFLTKPVQKKALLSAVESALARDEKNRSDRARLTDLGARYQSLTPRESAVFSRVTAGKLNKQIAVELGISERTVKAHRSTVMEKFNVRSVAELSRIAEQLHTPGC